MSDDVSDKKGEAAGEPPIQDILASIRKTIADDIEADDMSQATAKAGGGARAPSDPAAEEPLDLCEEADHIAEDAVSASGREAEADLDTNPDAGAVAATAASAGKQARESANMGEDTGRHATVSEATEQAAVDQLTGLARAADAAAGEDPPKSDTDRILEQMVREALRPQLEAWLDQNLPSLVERIVRREVRHMTRCAESRAQDEEPG